MNWHVFSSEKNVQKKSPPPFCFLPMILPILSSVSALLDFWFSLEFYSLFVSFSSQNINLHTKPRGFSSKRPSFFFVTVSYELKNLIKHKIMGDLRTTWSSNFAAESVCFFFATHKERCGISSASLQNVTSDATFLIPQCDFFRCNWFIIITVKEVCFSVCWSGCDSYNSFLIRASYSFPSWRCVYSVDS